MIDVKVNGSFKNTDSFLKKIVKQDYMSRLKYYGQKGVDLLSSATPRDTGKTANSWDYRIERYDTYTRIVWTNDNRASDGTPIAIYIQYGHMTGSNTYIQGRDYINPAMRPLFDKIANEISEEVRR